MSVSKQLRSLLIFVAIVSIGWWLANRRKERTPFELYFEQPPDLDVSEADTRVTDVQVESAQADIERTQEAEAPSPPTVAPPGLAMTGEELGLPKVSKDVAVEPQDDLTVIKGIGPKFASQLQAHGVTTFRALAAASVADLADICQTPAWRTPNFASWIEQAQKLAAAGENE